MTTLAAPPSAGPRLLGPAGDLPPASPVLDPRTVDLAELLAEVEAADLTGRGGAGFPTAIKLRSVTGRRGVVVGNAMEGEPLSHKDAVLLDRSPDLVLEGLRVVGRALRASRLVLAVGPDVPTPTGPHGEVEVRRLRGGFVAGQETAVVNQLDGGPAAPRDPLVRVTTRGVGGRPTLVLNAETLAQVALIARHGAAWFRTAGTPADPGTCLLTISGAVARPGVVEAPRGTPVAQVLAAAEPAAHQAVLVGGYHGAWVPAGAPVTLDRESLAPYGASVGAGILHVLAADRCPLVAAAQIATWLAQESAGQCGPCVNGLPHLADRLTRLAHLDRDPSLPDEIARVSALVERRGACAHPDGTVRMVSSTLRVFAGHVDEHLAGRCDRGLAR